MKAAKIIFIVVLILAFSLSSVQVYKCKRQCQQYGIEFLHPTNYSLVSLGKQPIPFANANGVALMKDQYILLKDNMPFKIECLEEK